MKNKNKKSSLKVIKTNCLNTTLNIWTQLAHYHNVMTSHIPQKMTKIQTVTSHDSFTKSLQVNFMLRWCRRRCCRFSIWWRRFSIPRRWLARIHCRPSLTALGWWIALLLGWWIALLLGRWISWLLITGILLLAVSLIRLHRLCRIPVCVPCCSWLYDDGSLASPWMYHCPTVRRIIVVVFRWHAEKEHAPYTTPDPT